MNKLYKCTNRQGEYMVVAQHPTEASDKLVAFLEEAEYGFGSERVPTKIELIASAVDHPSHASKEVMVLINGDDVPDVSYIYNPFVNGVAQKFTKGRTGFEACEIAIGHIIRDRQLFMDVSTGIRDFLSLVESGELLGATEGLKKDLNEINERIAHLNEVLKTKN